MQRLLPLLVLAAAALAAQAQAAGDAQRSVRRSGDGTLAARGSFSTAGGTQGQRSAQFQRGDDGSVDARRSGGTSGDKGRADSSRSFTRNADGDATGQRSTTATRADTGVTYEGTTTYTQGSGFSRSAGCKDASGQTVTCGAAR